MNEAVIGEPYCQKREYWGFFPELAIDQAGYIAF
jgi:hypothetical protein